MNELTILLDTALKTPLYEQIYAYIRGEIRRGNMKAGEKLPSARALSAYLQVSRSTVDLAYDQLLSEGYISSIPCKGYYVCEIELLYDLPLETAPERKKTVPDKHWKYDFALNGIDEESFPFNTWSRLVKNAMLDTEHSMFRQGGAAGDMGLREALAEYLHHARGVNCVPEQIIVGAGNDYLLMLLSVLLGKNRVIAMENPTYLNAYQCFMSLGHTVHTLPMDASGIQVQKLKTSGADVAYVMPSHQFPTGVVMPMSRRTQLLRWAAENPRHYIVEDDYDSEFRYKGKPIPALQGNDGGQNVIYLGTFSKSIAPSIRISYMVLPISLMPAYEKKGACFSTTVSRVDQRVIECFLREGGYERHLNRMRGRYKLKHDILVQAIRNNRIPCTICGENAGVHILLRLKEPLTEREALERAAEREIKVYSLSEYCISGTLEKKNQGILLGYAGLPCDKIEKAAAELAKAWKY